MENSDNQLRDKLNSNEFPFDPQAWAGMETMLDEKKKRRGFFWWWTGGIAAALLCGVVGFELHNFVGGKTPGTELLSVQNQTKRASGTNEQTAEKATSNNGGINQQPAAEIGSGPENSGAGQFENRHKQLNTAVNNNATATNPPALTGTNSNGQNRGTFNEDDNSGMQAHEKQLASKAAVKNTGEKNSGFAGFNSLGRGAGAGKRTNQYTTALTSTAAIQAQEVTGSIEPPIKTADEILELNTLQADLLTAKNPEVSLEKAGEGEDELLPKQKQKIFNYSIGVAANITGTTLGKQTTNPGAQKNAGLFYNRLGYMVGFTHDFLFVNRIAITNSILYSQTSFDVLKPKSENYPVMLTYYTSKISELAIPVGLKLYPVVKHNFKMYVSAGIINHIKFKETFDYSVRTDTLFNTYVPSSTDQFFPTENSFEPGTKSHDVLSGVASAPATTDDFSLNKSKRYYTSFYAAAGVEYIAKNHFILFCEPMFYMSLQKIGVQDKRKYNVGGTGGFRYQF